MAPHKGLDDNSLSRLQHEYCNTRVVLQHERHDECFIWPISTSVITRLNCVFGRKYHITSWPKVIVWPKIPQPVGRKWAFSRKHHIQLAESGRLAENTRYQLAEIGRLAESGRLAENTTYSWPKVGVWPKIPDTSWPKLGVWPKVGVWSKIRNIRVPNWPKLVKEFT